MAWNEPNNSNRDPWSQGPGGGRGGRREPPDLERLFKRLRERLRGGGKPPPGSVYGALAAVLVALWLLSGFYVVDAQQQAVVLRLGRVAGIHGPGLGWHLPWPIATVRKEKVGNVRQASVDSTLITADRNLVNISLTVQYRIHSLPHFLFDLQGADDTLSQAARSALRQVVAGYDVDAVLGDAQPAIASKVKAELQQVLSDYHSGLTVTDVSLSQVQPPEAVQDAFADAIKAADDRDRMKNDAEAYAKDRLPRARGQAAREIAEAKVYRDQVVARAQGETARFDELLAEYRKAPQITRQRLYIDTMRDILEHSRIILVDAPGSSIKLDLSGLKPRSAEKTGSDDAAPPPAAAGATQRGGGGGSDR